MSIAQTGPAARDVKSRDPITIAVDTPFLEVQEEADREQDRRAGSGPVW